MDRIIDVRAFDGNFHNALFLWHEVKSHSPRPGSSQVGKLPNTRRLPLPLPRSTYSPAGQPPRISPDGYCFLGISGFWNGLRNMGRVAIRSITEVSGMFTVEGSIWVTDVLGVPLAGHCASGSRKAAQSPIGMPAIFTRCPIGSQRRVEPKCWSIIHSRVIARYICISCVTTV